MPRSVYIAAQAVVGTALGAGFSPATLLTLPRHFSIFAFAVIFILLTSLFNGWILTRSTRLDVATAFLGTMPGGAGEMAAMSDSLGADSRLVVIMQYTRLLLILASLALATPFLSHHSPPNRVGEAVTTALAPATFAWWKIVALTLLASIGWLTGMRTRIPAGTFLVPTVLYFLLEISGIQLGRWPWPVFAIAYLVMGLQIGGRFRPSTLAAIKDILLPVAGTTLLLLTGSFVLAWILNREMGSIRSAPIWLPRPVDSTPGSRGSRTARRHRRHPHGPFGRLLRANRWPLVSSGLLEVAAATAPLLNERAK